MPPRITKSPMTPPNCEKKRQADAPSSNSIPSPQRSEDNSTSSTLFYLTATNYSEVESAYMTSDEVGYHDDYFRGYSNDDDDYDDDDRGKDDRDEAVVQAYSSNLDDGISTPRCNNSRHGSTDVGRRNKGMNTTAAAASAIGTDDTMDVKLNPLMSSLLGIEILPRSPDASPFLTTGTSKKQLSILKRELQVQQQQQQSQLSQEQGKRQGISFDIHGSSIDMYSSDDEDDDDDDDDEEEEECDVSPTCHRRPTIDLGIPMSPNMHNVKQRRRGPIRRLRRQLTNNKHNEKNKRNRRKKAKVKAKHHNLISDTSKEIDHQLLQVEIARKRLQAVKSDLKFTQSRAKKLMMSAQQSANRVSKLSKNIIELECKLDMSLRALEQERDAINQNLAKLAHLNAMEKALEDEARAIRTKLSNHLENTESVVTEKPVVYVNGIHLDDDTQDPMGAIVAQRRRAETDASFMTAQQSSPTMVHAPLRKRSASHNDLGHDRSHGGLESQSAKNVQVSPTPQTTHENKTKNGGSGGGSGGTLLRMSSFLRVHDLDMDESHRIKLKNISRPDLFPIHSDDSYHALNALMKLAMKCATDESSRWTPDRTTEKIISKRPASEHKWHYATMSDIFVWYGKLETGYKSEIPVIKARAIVKTSPRNLLELLIDSSKVTQYNKMSLGREDKEFIKEGIETNDGRIDGEAKIVRSVTNIPMIRKKLELLSLMHARTLDDKKDGMKGYIIVNRSVWEDEKRVPSDDGDGEEGNDSNYIRSEVLLGVNLIRELDQDGMCEITTINHFYTPGTPTFGARQFGMKAAANFLRDIQNQFG